MLIEGTEQRHSNTYIDNLLVSARSANKIKSNFALQVRDVSDQTPLNPTYQPYPRAPTLQQDNMPSLSAHPALPYISTFFGTIFLGFGITYILYPRTGYELYGFSTSPTNGADWSIMERVMILYGAKDVFMAVALLSSTWYGSRKSTGLVLLAASATAGVDGYVVGSEAGTNHWNHWGYGSVMGAVGLVMTGLLG